MVSIEAQVSRNLQTEGGSGGLLGFTQHGAWFLVSVFSVLWSQCSVFSGLSVLWSQCSVLCSPGAVLWGGSVLVGRVLRSEHPEVRPGRPEVSQ